MTRVILADDHSIIRDGLKQFLAETDDLRVTGEAANGHELLVHLRQGEWDVLVLDISMPGKGGVDLIKQVHGEFPRLSILVFSMHLEEQYALRSLRAGASGYVNKESDVDVLIAAIRKVAGGGMHVSPRVAEMMAQEYRGEHGAAPHARLSDREYQVFEMLVLGRGLSDIARDLSLSVKTVSTHKTRIQQKLGLATTADMVRYAIANHLASLPD